MATTDSAQDNTSAFYLQAAFSLGGALFSVMAAVHYLPADPVGEGLARPGSPVSGHRDFHARHVRPTPRRTRWSPPSTGPGSSGLATHNPVKNAG